MGKVFTFICDFFSPLVAFSLKMKQAESLVCKGFPLIQ